MNAPLHLWLISLLPFVGFLLNGILGRKLPRALVSTIGLLAPLGSLAVVLNAARGLVALPYLETCPNPWISVGSLHIDFSLALDQLSLVMLLVVTGVGFLIHVYSVGYMHDDPSYARYFS
jgi:NADH-quinone oxidoreductase subunit L